MIITIRNATYAIEKDAKTALLKGLGYSVPWYGYFANLDIPRGTVSVRDVCNILGPEAAIRVAGCLNDDEWDAFTDAVLRPLRNRIADAALALRGTGNGARCMYAKSDLDQYVFFERTGMPSDIARSGARSGAASAANAARTSIAVLGADERAIQTAAIMALYE